MKEHSEQRGIPASKVPHVAERDLAALLLNDVNGGAVGATAGAVGSALTMGASKWSGKHDSGNDQDSQPSQASEGGGATV